ncbi:hypothetical protein [Nocardia sp. NPDC004860]|uniref:hypothetical protein n=1 Tax=Nocardia sp. NPDC004860 TaxID=3154557 RepID=UPI0033ABA676
MSRTSTIVDTDPDTAAESVDDSVTTAQSSDTRPRASFVSVALSRGRTAGQSSISVKTMLVSLLIVAVVVACGIFGWLLHDKSNELDAVHVASTDTAHAEQVAIDYATAAADMNFQDLASWRARLTKGTSPELSTRLMQAATSMEQIITPLQWVSTAKPIAAKVRSQNNGVYTVDCFVSVLTKNSQAPDGIQSTATYQLTLDSHNQWTITDIGGIGALAGAPAPR